MNQLITKTTLLAILFLFISFGVKGQNIVSNPGGNGNCSKYIFSNDDPARKYCYDNSNFSINVTLQDKNRNNLLNDWAEGHVFFIDNNNNGVYNYSDTVLDSLDDNNVPNSFDVYSPTINLNDLLAAGVTVSSDPGAITVVTLHYIAFSVGNGGEYSCPKSLEIKIYNTPNISIPVPDPITCLTNESVVLSVDGLEGAGPNDYDFSWTGDDIQSNSGSLTPTVQAGTYTLNLEFGACAVTTATVTVVEDKDPPSNASISASFPQIDCDHSTIDLTAMADNNPADLEYEWNINNETGQTITVDAGANYIVTITDTSNGCSTVTNITIGQDENDPNITAINTTSGGVTTNTLTCEITEITLDPQVSTIGNNVSLSYDWSDNSANPTLTVMNPGVYTVTVTNVNNGCFDIANIEIFIDDDEPGASIGSSNLELNCNTTSITLTAESNNSVVSFLWSNNATSQSIVIGSGQGGMYTVTVTNNGNKCESTATININENLISPDVDTTWTITNLTCQENDATLVATVTNESQSSGPFSYVLESENSQTTDENGVFTVSSPGTYTLVVTNTNTGCSRSLTQVISQNNTLPVANVSGGSWLDCLVSSIRREVNFNPSYSYLWQNIDDEDNPVALGTDTFVIITTPGVYQLQVTDNASDCNITKSFTIFEDNASPDIYVVGSNFTIDCSGEPEYLEILADSESARPIESLSYEWSTGNPLDTFPYLNATTTQTYTVTVTDNINGCTNTVAIEVTPDDASIDPTITANNNVTKFDCETNTIVLNASDGNGATNLEYEWSDGGVIGNINAQSIALVPEDVTNSSGTSFCVTITNVDNNCDAAECFTLTSNFNTPDASIQADFPQIDCDHNTVTLEAFPQGNNFMYNWDIPNVGNVSSTIVSNGGTYNVTVTNVNSKCSDVAEIEIGQDLVEPNIIILAPVPNKITCTNTEVELSAIIQNNSGSISMNYFWSTTNGAIKPGDENSATPKVTAEGVYTVLVTNPTSGCTSTLSTTVMEDKDAPTANILVTEESGETNNGEVCEEANFTLTVDVGNGGGDQFQWSTGDMTQVVDYSSVDVGDAGNYVVTVTNSANGCTITDDIDIIVYTLPDPTITGIPANNELAAGTIYDFACGNCTGSDTYEWSFGNGANFDSGEEFIANPSVFYNSQTEEYSVDITLTITSEFGCVGTTTQTVTVGDGIGCFVEVEIPTTNTSGGFLDFDYDSICVGEPINFSPNHTGSANGNGGTFDLDPNEVLWEFDVNNNGINQGATSTEVEPIGIIYNSPGTYNIRLSVKDDSGCPSQHMTTITVNGLPTINGLDNLPTNTVTCTDSVIILDASGSGSVTYDWSTGSDASSIDVNEDGTYGLTITNVSGCIDTAEVVIEKNTFVPDIAINPPNDITCTDSVISLTTTLNPDDENPEDYLYEWSSPSVQGGNDEEYLFINSMTGEGPYTVTITNPTNGCTDSYVSDFVNIDQVNPDFSIIVSETSGEMPNDAIICVGDDLTLNTISGLYTYEWNYPSNPFDPSSLSIENASINDAGNYQVTVTGANNGCTSSQAISVIVNTLPEVDSLTHECSFDKEYYQVKFYISGGVGPYSIQQIFTNNDDISDKDTINRTQEDIGFFLSDSIINKYLYNFTITDSRGCRAVVLENSFTCDCEGVFPNITINGEFSACQGEFNEGTLYTVTVIDNVGEGLNSIIWNIEGGIFIRPNEIEPADSIRNDTVLGNSMIPNGNEYVDSIYVKFTDSGNAQITVTVADIGSCKDPLTDEIPFKVLDVTIQGNVNVPSNQKIRLKTTANGMSDPIMFYSEPNLHYYWGRSLMDDISGGDYNLKEAFPDGTTDTEQQYFHFGENVNEVDLELDKWVYWVDVAENQSPQIEECRTRIYYNGPFVFREVEVEEYTPVEGFSMDIVPNPNQGEFNVQIESEIFGGHYVQLFDYTGKKVYESSFEKTEQRHSELLSLNTLPEGIYIVNVLDAEGNSESTKVLIK